MVSISSRVDDMKNGAWCYYYNCSYLFSFSVFAQDLNDAGRGLNIAVVNPSTKEVYRIGHFDTFESGKSF